MAMGWSGSTFRTAARRVKYLGLNYECPLCGSHLRSMSPSGYKVPVLDELKVVGAGYRRATCPVCHSMDRERLIYLYLRERTALFREPTRLLHVAPESSLRAKIVKARSIKYVTADISLAAVDVRFDIRDIPFGDDSFDAIICSHVLEHVIEDIQAMRELQRVLKTGGWAIPQVPMSTVLATTLEDAAVVTESDRERIFGQADHVRIYGRDYRARLEGVGFQVDAFDWQSEGGRAFGVPGNRFALFPGEELFVATKHS
jgi:SAM-dependent methyltransferase